jgi:hypothetical protein
VSQISSHLSRTIVLDTAMIRRALPLDMPNDLFAVVALQVTEAAISSQLFVHPRHLTSEQSSIRRRIVKLSGKSSFPSFVPLAAETTMEKLALAGFVQR